MNDRGLSEKSLALGRRNLIDCIASFTDEKTGSVFHYIVRRFIFSVLPVSKRIQLKSNTLTVISFKKDYLQGHRKGNKRICGVIAGCKGS